MGKRRGRQPVDPNRWLRRKISASVSPVLGKKERKHIERIQEYRRVRDVVRNGTGGGVTTPDIYLPRIRIPYAQRGGRQTKTVWYSGHSRRK